MRLFKAMTYVWSQLGSLVLGQDKEDILSRAKTAKEIGLASLTGIASSIEDADDKAMAYQAIAMAEQAFTEGTCNQPIFLDWCSSGISILSAITRCIKGMKSAGVFGSKPGNFYQLVADGLNAKLKPLVEFTRKAVKPFTIPYYYGGDANVRDELGEEGAEVFAEVYEELVPGAYAFRQETVDSWDEEATHYVWVCPDGFDVDLPVLTDSKSVTVSFGEHSYKCFFKVQGARPLMVSYGKAFYRNNHTKGNGANITHSIDGTILREMVGMSHMTQTEAHDILFRACTLEGETITRDEPGLLGRLLGAWEDTGYTSVRWFYALEECCGIKLPTELYSQLVQLANRLGDSHFDLLCIHDEFGCLPSHVNQMRKNANTIYANLYRSHIMNYFNKVFHMDVPVQDFDQKIYDQLLEVDYLLS